LYQKSWTLQHNKNVPPNLINSAPMNMKILVIRKISMLLKNWGVRPSESNQNWTNFRKTRVKFTHWLWQCAAKEGYCKLKFTQPTYFIWYYGTTDIRRHTPFLRPVTSSQPKNQCFFYLKSGGGGIQSDPFIYTFGLLFSDSVFVVLS